MILHLNKLMENNDICNIHHLILTDHHELTIEHVYTKEDYFTIRIKVKSFEFAGASNFCLARERIFSIIEKLSEMHRNLQGTCEVNDADSDSHMILEINKFGHLSIYGQIGGSHEDQYMKFIMHTDQTVLLNLIQLFKKWS